MKPEHKYRAIFVSNMQLTDQEFKAWMEDLIALGVNFKLNFKLTDAINLEGIIYETKNESQTETV